MVGMRREVKEVFFCEGQLGAFIPYGGSLADLYALQANRAMDRPMTRLDFVGGEGIVSQRTRAGTDSGCDARGVKNHDKVRAVRKHQKSV